MLEPNKNPNPRLMVDPPGWLRHLMRRQFDSVTDLHNVNKRRAKAERKRQRSGEPHIVEYFHQLDDPYSHLTAQVLATFAEREAELLGVPFGPMMTPIGEPTRQAYSLLPWAMEKGKDEALMSSPLNHAFSKGIGLHTKNGTKSAVEAAGLD